MDQNIINFLQKDLSVGRQAAPISPSVLNDAKGINPDILNPKLIRNCYSVFEGSRELATVFGFCAG